MIYQNDVVTDSGEIVRSEVIDTVALTVTTTADGETTTRALTPDEAAGYAANEDRELAAANTTQMVSESETAVDKLVAVVEALNDLTDLTNATINANPAAVIKDLARQCKTIARQVNREARLTSGRTEDTDTGPVTDV